MFFRQSLTIARSYEFAPDDISIAFYEVASKKFGPESLGGVRKFLFWRHPFNLVRIKTAFDENARGVVGYVTVSGLPGKFIIAPLGENGPMPQVNAYGFRRDDLPKVEEFLDEIKKRLDAVNMFRGKAIDTFGNFLDLSGVSENDVIYNEKVWRDLKAHVWSLIEHQDQCDELNVGPPQKVLFEGAPGFGKTLAAFLTAQKATKHKWTFVYLPPTGRKAEGMVAYGIALAHKLQPAIFFFEDVEKEQRDGNEHAFRNNIAAIDGITSKNAKLIIIYSTNYMEKIRGEMQRPGRIDKIIHFGVFNAVDIERLIKKTIPKENLSSEIVWENVAKKCEGFSQAFVQGTAKSALRFGVSDAGGKMPLVTEAMLIEAAEDLHGQHEKASSIGFKPQSDKHA